MKVRKVVRRRLGRSGRLDAVIAANVGERGRSVVHASTNEGDETTDHDRQPETTEDELEAGTIEPST